MLWFAIGYGFQRWSSHHDDIALLHGSLFFFSFFFFWVVFWVVGWFDFVMGFKSGGGDCWWMGERQIDKFGHGKPSFGSLEANPVLRFFMLLRLPIVHSFELLEKHSYVGGSLLWCAYDYIASCWTIFEVSTFLKFLSNFLPFLHNDIFFILFSFDFVWIYCFGRRETTQS